MKKKFIFAFLLGVTYLPQQALASANCPSYPKEDWASEDTLKEALELKATKLRNLKLMAIAMKFMVVIKKAKK